MSETLPVPVGDPRVLVEALAKAAAAIAAEEANARKEGAPLTRADVEAIAETVFKELFRTLLDVDLDNTETRRSFREDLAHTRKGREWHNKLIGIVIVTAMGLAATGLISGVFKTIAAALVAAGAGK
ncbi:hypothetical protein [Methylobacterium sp. CCH5-D2]|uniref:hypothetical protein n=1 Tax=Methylobacterium sp. CCH5-D2 TaxID=1768765 RepID=UPI000830A74D|nr:hypothetical protein [Methylobacterium sp. CCH5-D2]